MPSQLGRRADAQGHSAAAEPLRALYRTARWKALRWSILVRDGFRCRWPGCGKVASSPGLVADHIKAHRGDEALFWDPANLQALCKPCHDAHKQRAERRAAWD